MKVEYDGQVLEDDFFYGMVCNTYSVAGMRNLPTDRVELDDGLFEVILVRKPMSIGEIGAGLQTLLRPGAVEEERPALLPRIPAEIYQRKAHPLDHRRGVRRQP